MIEKEEDLFCSLKHKQPVLMIACDKELKKNQRLLCPLCMENLESKAQLMSFKKALENIEENQKSKKESVENVLMINIKQLELLQKGLHQLKSDVVQQLDYLIGNTDEWIKQVKIYGQQNVTYSFFDELEKLITQTKIDQSNQKSIINQINQINQSWNQKIFKKLNLFKVFQETQKCEELLKCLENINQIKENEILINGNQEDDIKKQKEVTQVEIQQKQLEQQLMIDKQIDLKLIDDSNQQSYYCFAIVFDKTGSIMISCENEKIKIWKFEQGRLKLINTYEKHRKTVTCLAYSKLMNNFISGSQDNTIICWQQINQKEWKCSQPFQQHNDDVYCLMLNKQENQLISGGSDKSIKVWNVDFMKNELTFQYSLDQHNNCVNSFSFNSTETVLVSCGFKYFIIWEKGVQGKWEFKYIIEQSEYLYLLLTHLLHFIEFIIQIIRVVSIFQMNFNISISLCIDKLFHFQVMGIRYIQLMINNFFGQLVIRMQIIFQYLNYRMESSNRILIKLSN